MVHNYIVLSSVMRHLCLYVFTKFHLTLDIVVHLEIEYDFRWALCFGHTTLEGKHVALEHNGVYHFHNHNGGKVFKWDYVVITVTLFVYSAVVSLDFWDVFVSRRDMTLGM